MTVPLTPHLPQLQCRVQGQRFIQNNKPSYEKFDIHGFVKMGLTTVLGAGRRKKWTQAMVRVCNSELQRLHQSKYYTKTSILNTRCTWDTSNLEIQNLEISLHQEQKWLVTGLCQQENKSTGLCQQEIRARSSAAPQPVLSLSSQISGPNCTVLPPEKLLCTPFVKSHFL